jgi:cytochrome c biogenesis protein CcmG/thiol:disulfide interchange protein DsbE
MALNKIVVKKTSLKKIIPLLAFIVVFLFLFKGLSLKPRVIPSVLIDKMMPNTTLPSLLTDGIGFSTEEIAKDGGLYLVNFYASWCGPCRVEHPSLLRLQELGYKIYGIAYKDKPKHAINFVENLGNPYVSIGVDLEGRAGVNWGVYAVPETFVIYRGRVIYKHFGVIHEQDMEDIEKLLKKADQKFKTEAPKAEKES